MPMPTKPSRIELSGSEEEDLARFSAYYADKRGVHPERQGDIRFIHDGARGG